MMPSDGDSQLSLIYLKSRGYAVRTFQNHYTLCFNVLLFLACEVVLLERNHSVFQSLSKKLFIAFI